VTQGTPHKTVVSDGDDPNHFDSSYFGKGLKWQLPDLEGSEKSYRIAKQVFEESGRKIIDATVNGSCQVFPKQDYKLIFKESLSNELQVKSITFSDSTIQPEVSIIVPAYNEERFLRDNLNSAVLQNFEKWECIVIDDCSSDSCSQIAQEYCRKDKRFRLIQHKKNSGLSASRNTGIRLAQGKYLTFLDGDDFFLQNSLSIRLKKIKELAEKRVDVVGVFCGAEIVREQVNNPFWENKRKVKNRIRDFITSESDAPFSPNAPILIKSIIDKFGGFDEKLLHGAEDWDMWLRLMRHGYCFEPVDIIAVAYREKRHSMVRSMAGQHLKEAQRLYAEANITLPEDLIVNSQAPYIFWRPRHYYATMLKYTQRAVKFLTMAKLSGDRAAYNQALSFLPPNSLFYVKRHLNLVEIVNEGMRRFYCISKDELKQKLDELKEVKQEIFSDINIALQQPDPVHSSLPDYAQNYSRPKYGSRLWRERIDILIIVNSKDDIKMLTNVVSDLQKLGLIAIFIDFDAILEDNDVREEMIKHELDYVSYAAYKLGDFKPQAILMSNLTRKLSLEEELLIESAKKANIKIIGIDTGYKKLENFTVNLCDTVILGRKADGEKLANKECILAKDNLSNSIVETVANNLDIRPPFDGKKLFATQITMKTREIESKTSAPDYVRLEEHSPYPVDEEELSRFKDIHKGERCFIIGNGPSLNKHNLSLLKNDVSIGVNGIFYKTKESGFSPTYYVVEDDAVMRENIEQIKTIQTKHKFFPSVYRHLHPKDRHVSFFLRNRGFYEKNSPNYCIPRFSTDMSQRLYCGQSVTIINLQIAFYMGFTTVYLMGMDFSYVIPPEFKRRGVLITSTGDDPNHFHKDYFGVGKTWKDPKLEMVKRNYELCKMIYEWNDRKIYNASIGGKLEVFERVDYNSLFL
jgi:glycosyltransferase involved in cell wall biosynthesis